MNKSALIAAAAAVIGAVALPAAASAQMMPPMDMSWAMQSQMQNYAYGQMAAQAAAQQYLNYMTQLRRQGYTGPSLPTGVTHQSLQESIRGAQAAGDAYIRGGQVNSARTGNAIGDYSYRAIRGCAYGATYDYRYRAYVC